VYQNLESGGNPPLRAASEPVVRPRDASSLIITRRERQKIFVLMGRRSPTARFMPGVFVFPGGAVSSGDGRVLPAAELDPTYTPLMGIGRSHSRARALAMAAVRERFERRGKKPGCSLLCLAGSTAAERPLGRPFDHSTRSLTCGICAMWVAPLRRHSARSVFMPGSLPSMPVILAVSCGETASWLKWAGGMSQILTTCRCEE